MDCDPVDIDTAEFEHGLERVREAAAGPVTGIFGPDSMIWQIDRESLVFLGAGRALLMQLAHPWVATAVAEHSAALADPIGRFHRTFRIVFTLVFGSLEQALSTALHLHRRHAAITGSLPDRIGAFPEGSNYFANEASALMWVHATLIDTALAAYELVLPPLQREARERYYAECRTLGALFGISLASQPDDWAAFTQYRETMLASDRLAVGASARTIGASVLKGAGQVPVPRWYRDVTAALLPERLREAFGLPFGPREQRSAALALGTIRTVHPALPGRLRYVAPYQEALARLSGDRRPDLGTQWLNRLWIGHPSMDR